MHNPQKSKGKIHFYKNLLQTYMLVFIIPCFVKFLFEFPSFVHNKSIVENIKFKTFDKHFTNLTDPIVAVGFKTLVIHGSKVFVSQVKWFEGG